MVIGLSHDTADSHQSSFSIFHFQLSIIPTPPANINFEKVLTILVLNKMRLKCGKSNPHFLFLPNKEYLSELTIICTSARNKFFLNVVITNYSYQKMR